MPVEKVSLETLIKENIPYTIHINSVIQKIRDCDALGVWTYLTSLPPDWVVHHHHLHHHFNFGRDKLRKILRILKEFNLIEIEQSKNVQGKYEDTYIMVKTGSSHQPVTENTVTENPAEKPATCFPAPGNQPSQIDINTQIENKELSIIPFDQFWEAYPKKVCKKDAHKSWNKNKLDEKVDFILADLNQRKKQNWFNKPKQYIPNPATYLNGERWNDELYSEKSGGSNGRQTNSEKSWGLFTGQLKSELQRESAKQANAADVLDFDPIYEISNDLGD